MFRYCRIAWTVLCLAACVSLLALAVRSRRTLDQAFGAPFDLFYFGVTSDRGSMNLVVAADTRGMNTKWGAESYPINTRGWHYARSTWHLQWLEPAAWVVSVPHWIAAILAAAAAGLPWVKWRFGLRTLLIGMTLIAIALGLIVAT